MNWRGRAAQVLEMKLGRAQAEGNDPGMLVSDLAKVHIAKGRRQFLQACAQQSQQIQLPQEMQEALEASFDPIGHVQHLPVNVQHLYAQQQGAKHSVDYAKGKAWLETLAGKVWQQERRTLLEADDFDL